MKIISATLRFICGMALILFSWFTHQRAKEHLAAGEPMQIAGVTLGASPFQVRFALITVAAIGALLVVLGGLTLMKARR